MSQRAYARHAGVSVSTVNSALKSGRITLVDGKIDPDRADREWSQNTDPSTPRNRITGRPKLVRVPGQPSEPMDLGGESGSSTASGYARARAAREIAQAQLARLELEQKRGTLVEASQVRLAAFNCARKARDQLLAIPERVAVVLAAATDAGEVSRILELEVERICEELSE
jgi:hypothetical protein